MASDTDIDIPKRLAAWRAHCDLTLQQVADASGVSKQMVSYVEHGDCDITVQKLDRICTKAFRTTLREFLGPLPSAARSARSA